MPANLEMAIVAGDTIAISPLPERGAVTLGRDDDCDIRIDNRSVSRRHAILHLGPVLRIQDLGSVNGTFVRDGRLPADTIATQPLRKLSRETIEIAVGERVSLGSIPIVVRRQASDPASERRGAPDAPVVRDPAMLGLYEQLTRAARSPISVLLLGETGVGKEVLARALHDRSPRARGPFLELHCAALPPSLLESELFGHEKHAFTGANQARAGLLESADGGTVFLDEIGELPIAVQAKLLRVLETHKVLRIGGRSARQLDVRFVAATNRELETEIARGGFRQDLYFRLNGISLEIPPLRARVAEIAPLAGSFLAAAAAMLDRSQPFQLSPEALRHLESYAWPGNVRELRNAIERAAVLASGDVIMPADLPRNVTQLVSRARPQAAVEPDPAVRVDASPTPQGATERERILDALQQTAGNQTRAARLLGISVRTLINRLDKHSIPRPRKRLR